MIHATIADSPMPELGRARRAIATPATLASLILATLGLQQLLLWRFLGFSPLLYPIGAGLILLLVAGLRRMTGWAADEGPSVRLFALCSAVSLLLFVLGGEGRFLYANFDWQVRSAVLRDLVIHPWPFAYVMGGPELLLRVPLGMYLPPALVGKALGFRAAELALLIQNSLLLATLLALGATLFRGAAARVVALIVFVGFSGMDILGAMLTRRPVYDHIEGWLGPQYSSHVTQAFWVPQHAMAGWIGALLYLLWREGRAPRTLFLAALPLLALMSPLSLMGLMPFAAHAGLDGLLRRKLGWRDVAWPALALAIATPSLLYLAAAGDTVGGGGAGIDWPRYLVFEMIEVAGYFLALLLAGEHRRFGGATFAIVAGVLLLAPLGRIGDSVDFVMRASIPALMILSLTIADLIASPAKDRAMAIGRTIAVVVFAIGLATPALEIARAFRLPPSPETLCSYPGVASGGAATYVAPLDRVPAPVRPARPTLVTPHDPSHCWGGPWPDPVI